MGAIQSSIGGVIGAAIGAVGAAKVKDIADAKKEEIKAPKEEPKTDMEKIKKEAAQNRITLNKVIDKAAEANRISMAHVEARRSQAETFKERLNAVKTGTWKASRTKLKRRGK